MKMENKKKLGLGLGAAAIITAVVAATRVKAAPPVVICTPGDEKCIGPDWCRCNPEGTKWDVVIPNATVCEVQPLTATLYGTVTNDTGAPIGGIDVNCNGYTDTTAPDGTYRIENIPPGEYSVIFTDPLGRYEEKII